MVATIILENGINVNLEMVRQGHAIAYTRYLDDELRPKFLAAQQEAKANKRGIWQGDFIEPAKWRRGERLDCEQQPS